MKPSIILGKDAHGKNVALDIDTLIKTRLLIQANSGGGKSFLIRRMCEQLFGHVPVIIIDPEGEFATLREKFGYVLVGKGGETPADPRSAKLVAHKLLELRASAVIDLYEMNPRQRHEYVKLFSEAMIDAPKNLWRPTIIVFDEAHTWCPEKGSGESVASDAVTAFPTRGRKRRFCAVFATQRLGKLRKDASAELLNRLIGPTFEDVDLKRAIDLLSIPADQKREFEAGMRVLDPGNFYALGRAICKERTLFKVGGVETSHEIEEAKFGSEPPPTPERIKNLLPQLADLPKQAETAAKTESELKAEIRTLKQEVQQLKAAKPQVTAIKPPKPVSIFTDDDRKLIKFVAGKCEEDYREFEKMFFDYSKELQRLRDDLNKLLTKSLSAQPQRAGFVKSTHISTPNQSPVTAVRRPVPTPSPAPPIDGEFKPSKCQRGVLTVLNQFPNGCEINKIALLACYSVSGGFKTELSGLRTAGAITGENTSTMRITEFGKQFAEDKPLPEPGEERIRFFREHRAFSKAQRAVIDALSAPDALAEGFTIDTLASLTNYAVSGGFKTELSGLRTAGVIIGGNTEHMRLNPEMYE